jgi:hypothetical protein
MSAIDLLYQHTYRWYTSWDIPLLLIGYLMWFRSQLVVRAYTYVQVMVLHHPWILILITATPLLYKWQANRKDVKILTTTSTLHWFLGDTDIDERQRRGNTCTVTLVNASPRWSWKILNKWSYAAVGLWLSKVGSLAIAHGNLRGHMETCWNMAAPVNDQEVVEDLVVEQGRLGDVSLF